MIRFLRIAVRINLRDISRRSVYYFVKRRREKRFIFTCFLVYIFLVFCVFIGYKEHERRTRLRLEELREVLRLEELYKKQIAFQCPTSAGKVAKRTNTTHINHIFYESQLEGQRKYMRIADKRMLTNFRGHCHFPESVSLLFLIPSGFRKKDAAIRQAVRETWGNAKILRHRYGAGILFFLGYNPDSESLKDWITQDLKLEAAINHDIVILPLPLPDRYTNLSLKVLSMLYWTISHCHLLLSNSSTNHAGIAHVVKSDQDSFWNVAKLRSLLGSLPDPGNRRAVLGNVQYNATVHRNQSSSWKTGFSEYKEALFPDYATGGAGYVITANSLKPLLSAAEARKVFWLEDVYITGVLAKRAGIHRVPTDSIYYCKPIPLTIERYENVVAAHYISQEDMYYLFSMQLTAQTNSSNQNISTDSKATFSKINSQKFYTSFV